MVDQNSNQWEVASEAPATTQPTTPAQSQPQGNQQWEVAHEAAAPLPPQTGAAAHPDDDGFFSNVWKGVQAGATETAVGAAKLASHVPGVGYLEHKAGEAIGLPSMDESQQIVDQQKKESMNSVGGMIGYGGESLVEFMLGDEALKGLSAADKFLQAGKVAKLLERSPRLMEALKAGANLEKAKGMLSPEAMMAIRANPVLGRVVSAGMSAIRSGLVQFGQTAVRTNDIGEAAKQGVEMAGMTAGVGAATGLVGGTLAKGRSAARTMEAVNSVAESAPSKSELTDQASNMVKNTREAMHTRFNEDIAEKVGDPLSGIERPLEGSPFHTTANEIIGTMEGADKLDKLRGETVPMTAEAKRYVKGVANALAEKKPAKKSGELSFMSFLDSDFPDTSATAAKGESAAGEVGGEAGAAGAAGTAGKPPEPPYMLDIDKLVKERQALGNRAHEAWKSQQWGDYQAYRKLQDGIDSTIQQMAEGSGKPEVVSDYSAIREQYRRTMRLFDNKDTKGTVDALMRGNVADVTKELTGGKFGPAKIDTIRNIVDDVDMNGVARAPGNSQKLFDGIFQDLTSQASQRDASGNVIKNTFDPEKFMRLLEPYKKNPEVLQGLFPLDNTGKSSLDAAIKAIGNAASVKKLTKVGLLSGVGGFVWGPLGALIGTMFRTEGTSGAAQLINHIANHPKMWNTLSALSGAADSRVAQGAKRVVQYGAGRALSGMRGQIEQDQKETKRNVYAGADGLSQ